MDSVRMGDMIRRLRSEKGLTQLRLAEMMGISDKTVSKWERGLGCPDVSLLAQLADILGVGLEGLLSGIIKENTFLEGNMKKSRFYVCERCGNVVVSTGDAEVLCCGRKLPVQEMKKATPDAQLHAEVVEDEWYITAPGRAMTKDDYISFVAFITGDSVHLIKQYPEWDLQVRFKKRGHGMLAWYSEREGLMYRLL